MGDPPGCKERFRMYSHAFYGSAALKPVDEPRITELLPKRHLHAIPRFKGPLTEQFSIQGDIPPPNSEMIQKLAIYGYEVLDGSRVIAQLAGWITRNVAEQLASRRAARTERRTLYRDERRFIPTPGPVHLSRVSDRVAEATVVLKTDARCTAVAIRLEFLHRRWRATDLTVL